LSWDIAADGDFANVILRIWQVGKEKDDPTGKCWFHGVAKWFRSAGALGVGRMTQKEMANAQQLREQRDSVFVIDPRPLCINKIQR